MLRFGVRCASTATRLKANLRKIERSQTLTMREIDAIKNLAIILPDKSTTQDICDELILIESKRIGATAYRIHLENTIKTAFYALREASDRGDVLEAINEMVLNARMRPEDLIRSTPKK